MDIAPDWAALRLRLETLMAAVEAEIRDYPPPIPACDAQFNHLLELRRLIPAELARLEAAAADGFLTVDAFILTSPCKAQLAEADLRG
ncbi:MAG TPA: hypothetical protein VGC25_11130 [Alphaproteobacteria bacterium]|jgi:hypothetical protein